MPRSKKKSKTIDKAKGRRSTFSPAKEGRQPDIVNLVCVEGPLKGSVYDRREDQIIVGRTKGRWKLYVEDEYVSEKHARIFWEPDKEIWMVRDLGSSNGTTLNLIELKDEGCSPQSISSTHISF